MRNTRTKNVLLIMTTSGITQFLNFILQFVSRTVFIKVLGAEYLGLNGLFSNILSFLSLAELGIGSAISFYLYQPISEGNTERIKALMQFYKKCYRAVGLIMIIAGLCIIPLLPQIVNFEQNVPVNLYVVYLLYLLNMACSYLMFAYKQALPMANQEQYKIEKINILFVIINCITDIVVLVLFKSYVLYLLLKLILVLVKNIVISIKVDKEYEYLKEKGINFISNTEIRIFFKDIKDIAMFKLGSTLYNSSDNIIISVLLGTIIVGYYSNYFLIISILSSLINLFVKSFMASVGNLIVEESKDAQYNYFIQIDFIVYYLVSICTTCLFQLLNSFIRLWIGGINYEYILSQTVVTFLCISFYFDGTTQVMNIFREAGGFFQVGRELQIIGGLLNIVLSIILGKIWGLEGIFAATVISKGVISLFPFILKISCNVFEKSIFTVLRVYLKHGIVTVLNIIIVWYICRKIHMTTTMGFAIETMLTMLVSVAFIGIVFYKTPEMMALLKRIKNIKRVIC